jgi:hypothetical protein
VFVVIAQHLEHQFSQGEPVLEGLEVLEFGGVPDADDVRIDGPDYVIKEIAQKCHQMLEYIHYLQIQRLLGLDIFNDGGKGVNPFQKFEYLPCIFHSPSNFMGDLCASIGPSSKLQKHILYFRVLVAIIIKIGDILYD